jgi:glycosyltransferase involved in cell wall biosynthesis
MHAEGKTPVKLDVVVPTYNRSALLRRTIASLLQAPIPAGLDVTILIVDNNSKDDTEQVVREIQSHATRPIVYVRETNQGLSNARNGGIRAGAGEIIGFIDDDEEIHQDWYNVVAREFADHTTQFIGGPYLANWAAPAPAWLPLGYRAAIGVIDPKPRSPFGATFQGNLMGGNAVVRRSAFDRVGLYSPNLGRSGKVLLSEEDAEFYRRLRNADLHGMYVPDLIIYHHIPAERLTRRYHRSWCYWRGVSQGIADKDLKEPVLYVLGVPLYRIGRAIKSMALLPKHFLSSKGAGQAFADELATWDLLGFIHGRYFIRIERYYARQ